MKYILQLGTKNDVTTLHGTMFCSYKYKYPNSVLCHSRILKMLQTHWYWLGLFLLWEVSDVSACQENGQDQLSFSSCTCVCWQMAILIRLLLVIARLHYLLLLVFTLTYLLQLHQV